MAEARKKIERQNRQEKGWIGQAKECVLTVLLNLPPLLAKILEVESAQLHKSLTDNGAGRKGYLWWRDDNSWRVTVWAMLEDVQALLGPSCH
jgi:hypothetical protein